MHRLLSGTFGLLFLFTIVRVQDGYTQAIDPLIDTPGKTIGSDFNGDGIHDFIVGAPYNDDGGSDDEGAAYIFFGATNLSGTKNLGGGQSADVTILGKATNNNLGNSVSSVGDINGDGLDDIIVGARLNDDGANNGGAAFIFFGSTSLSGTKALGGVQSADVTFLAESANDYFGRSVSGAGDVNGDGFDDIIVGADGFDISGASGEGAVYIFFGSSSLSGTKALGGGQSADVTIIGKAGFDGVGRSVSGAGDVNGDGFDDVTVGAYQNDDGPTSGSGAAYIIFGASDLSGTKSLGRGQSADVTILGKAGDKLGRSTSGSGDVNGDGFDDIVVGGYGNDEGPGNDPGAAYIIFGATNLSGTKALGGGQSADFTILGKASSDELGKRVSIVGDVNDDGIDDIMVGAYQYDYGAVSESGAAYVFFGSNTLSGTKSLGGADSADVSVLGNAESDNLGFGLSGVGDINADGIADFIVTARRTSDGAYYAGAAYVFFGASTLSGTFNMGGGPQAADVTFLGKSAQDYLGFSVGGGRSNPGP